MFVCIQLPNMARSGIEAVTHYSSIIYILTYKGKQFPMEIFRACFCYLIVINVPRSLASVCLHTDVLIGAEESFNQINAIYQTSQPPILPVLLIIC